MSRGIHLNAGKAFVGNSLQLLGRVLKDRPFPKSKMRSNAYGPNKTAFISDCNNGIYT
jgi:hypothetical protein